MKKNSFFAIVVFSMILVGCNNPSNISSEEPSYESFDSEIVESITSNSVSSDQESFTSEMIESNLSIMEGESSNPSEESSYSSMEEKFTITVINGTGSGEFIKGQEVTIVANNPEKGKVFEGWKDIEGYIVSTNASYTFVVTNDVTLTASYVTATVTITVIQGTGSGEYSYGDQVTITANAPEDGKEFLAWMIEGGDVFSREETYTFTAEENLNIYASYSTIFYDVEVEGGSILGTTPCVWNQEITITAEEVPGKVFAAWENESGDIISEENPYTFNVTNDVKLIATYEDVIISTFVKPENVDDVKEDLAKASLVQGETSSMVYHDNNNNKYGSTDLNIEMFSDGLYAHGTGTTSSYSSSYELTHIYKLEEGKLSEVKDFAYSSNYYDYANRYNVVEVVQDEDKEVSQVKANELITSYGMISNVSSLFNNFENTTTLVVEDLSETSFKVNLVNAKDTSSTMHSVFTLSLTFNAPDYYISNVEYSNKAYVKATQMAGGVLKDDATPRDTFETSYSFTRLEGEKSSLPSDKDITPYFISDFEFEGYYYEGSTRREFDKNNNKIALGVSIDISRLSMVSGTVLPSTSLENQKLTFVSSSDEEVIKATSNTQLQTFKEGTATITVSTLSGVTKSMDIEVGILPPTSLTISSESKVLKDEKIELTVSQTPSTSSNEVNWTIDNSDLAEIVLENDKVYLLGKVSGYVTVTATSKTNEEVKATKTIYVSEGNLSEDQLKTLLVGTWFEKKSSYSDSGFEFKFNADGSLVVTDTYRGASAKISCIATWELTTNSDEEMTHNGSYASAISDCYVIKVTVIEMTDSPAYWMDLHLAIAKDGSSLTYHFIPGSTSGNTQGGILTKIA